MKAKKATRQRTAGKANRTAGKKKRVASYPRYRYSQEITDGAVFDDGIVWVFTPGKKPFGLRVGKIKGIRGPRLIGRPPLTSALAGKG